MKGEQMAEDTHPLSHPVLDDVHESPLPTIKR